MVYNTTIGKSVIKLFKKSKIKERFMKIMRSFLFTLQSEPMALSHEARGKGIVRKLVENLIDNAKAKGVAKILSVAV